MHVYETLFNVSPGAYICGQMLYLHGVYIVYILCIYCMVYILHGVYIVWCIYCMVYILYGVYIANDYL